MKKEKKDNNLWRGKNKRKIINKNEKIKEK